ncbi:hypothetical protein QBC44DRAFT_337044 [Cladorrhinum sp. PSN332]|nr:hypothetical protein QBC44DRAFT_337044 [Cladorrhinum sp. PSN332]
MVLDQVLFFLFFCPFHSLSCFWISFTHFPSHRFVATKMITSCVLLSIYLPSCRNTWMRRH